MACPVGGVRVRIMVTAFAVSGMYFETLTSIGAGSTGASGGTSDCWTCTMAGGVCMSIVWLRGGLARPANIHLREAPVKSIFQIAQRRHPARDGGQSWRQRPKQMV